MTKTDARAWTQDLRLYVIAGLATAYVIAWWAFAAPAGHAPAPVTSAPPAPEPPPANVAPALVAPSAAWYEDVPASLRPPVVLPPGWQLAAPAAGRPSIAVRMVPAASAYAPLPAVSRPVRVIDRRPRRVRTRSS